jgi:hypothetical protein
MNFRSFAEQNLADWFDRNGVKYEYETRRYSYVSRIKGGVCEKCGEPAVQNRVYTLDFWLPDYDFGVEVKGRLPSNERKKYRDIKKCNENLDLRFLFLANNKLEKDNEKRYSDWAEQHGFPYCIRSIEARWFK